MSYNKFTKSEKYLMGIAHIVSLPFVYLCICLGSFWAIITILISYRLLNHQYVLLPLFTFPMAIFLMLLFYTVAFVLLLWPEIIEWEDTYNRNKPLDPLTLAMCYSIEISADKAREKDPRDAS